MCHWNTSSSPPPCQCRGTNGGKTDGPSEAAAFLPSASSYTLLARGGGSSSPPPLHEQQQQQPCHSAPLASPSGAMAAAAPFRRVLSTGDLEEEHGRAAAVAVRRLTAEERRERIERYRSKRGRRNFRKKITYACRKTLADRRTRVGGRFVRDGGGGGAKEEASDSVMMMMMTMNNNYHTRRNENVVNGDGSSGGGVPVPKWWPAMQEELAREEEDADGREMLASYLAVVSSNLDSSYSCSDQPH